MGGIENSQLEVKEKSKSGLTDVEKKNIKEINDILRKNAGNDIQKEGKDYINSIIKEKKAYSKMKDDIWGKVKIIEDPIFNGVEGYDTTRLSDLLNDLNEYKDDGKNYSSSKLKKTARSMESHIRFLDSPNNKPNPELKKIINEAKKTIAEMKNAAKKEENESAKNASLANATKSMTRSPKITDVIKKMPIITNSSDFISNIGYISSDKLNSSSEESRHNWNNILDLLYPGKGYKIREINGEGVGMSVLSKIDGVKPLPISTLFRDVTKIQKKQQITAFQNSLSKYKNINKKIDINKINEYTIGDLAAFNDLSDAKIISNSTKISQEIKSIRKMPNSKLNNYSTFSKYINTLDDTVNESDTDSKQEIIDLFSSFVPGLNKHNTDKNGNIKKIQEFMNSSAIVKKYKNISLKAFSELNLLLERKYPGAFINRDNNGSVSVYYTTKGIFKEIKRQKNRDLDTRFTSLSNHGGAVNLSVDNFDTNGDVFTKTAILSILNNNGPLSKNKLGENSTFPTLQVYDKKILSLLKPYIDKGVQLQYDLASSTYSDGFPSYSASDLKLGILYDVKKEGDGYRVTKYKMGSNMRTSIKNINIKNGVDPKKS